LLINIVNSRFVSIIYEHEGLEPCGGNIEYSVVENHLSQLYGTVMIRV